jgi:hypothetical protein
MSVEHDEAGLLSCRSTELTVFTSPEEVMERADVPFSPLYCRVFLQLATSLCTLW